jgi:DNA-binding GntR family transcriptional regulator
MNTLPRIKKENLSEQVYHSIRNSLMDGQYAPGDRLTIAGLAEQMGVSITPVREAIFRLVSERALEFQAATSVHVRRLSPDELREIQIIRSHLEGEAAAQAARHVSAAALEDMERLQARFSEAAASDPLEASWLNRAFHFALAGEARMPLLLATIESMWAQMGPLIHLYHLNTPKRDLVSKDHPHYEVLRALARRDAEAARAAIQRDIALGAVMVRWLEERGQA